MDEAPGVAMTFGGTPAQSGFGITSMQGGISFLAGFLSDPRGEPLLSAASRKHRLKTGRN